MCLLQSWALAEAADGELGLARDMLQKATTPQPRSVPCWHAWAKLELTAGNIEKARQLYLKALELKPTETFTLSELANKAQSPAGCSSVPTCKSASAALEFALGFPNSCCMQSSHKRRDAVTEASLQVHWEHWSARLAILTWPLSTWTGLWR